MLAGGSAMMPGGAAVESETGEVAGSVGSEGPEGADVTGRSHLSASTEGEPAVTGDGPATRRLPVAGDADPEIWKGFGAWIDLYDMHLDPAATSRLMARHGVRTLYIQTSHSHYRHALDPRMGRWLVAAHREGIKVVGWYLPDYRSFERDVRRTVRIARYQYQGHRFDGIGIDIENRRGVPNALRWSRRVAQHAAAVREAVGPGYPVSSITPTPLQMRLAPGHWAGFPWRSLARHTDAILLMSYWTERTGCPRVRHHCAYEFTRYNVEITRDLIGGADIPVHIIGGVGDRSSPAQVRAFVRGARDSGADGGSFYDVVVTRAAWWPILSRLQNLG